MISLIVHDLDVTLSALADPTRRRVVELLRTAPRRAGELADEVSMSRPALSRHLRVLRESGVVEVELLADDARGRVYRLRSDGLQELQSWLDQIQAYWTEQLGAFKAHAERRTP
jgi:DNA-binding transcriptional ArsR family regulator